MNNQNRDPGTLEYTRTFEAPRELVFRCMTTPEHLIHFWGPFGVNTPLEEIEVDLRPGGVFTTVMVNESDGGRYTTRAVFVEIDEPERLVWTDPDSGMTTTSTFREIDPHHTEVHISQINVPVPFRGAEAQSGFKSSLDRFELYLRSLAENADS